jgi:hypothetical protein
MVTPSSNRLVVFDSIHHVLAAERALKEKGLWCDLVPTPRALSSDCGMALEYDAADDGPVRVLLADPRLRVRGVHKYDGSGYKPADGRDS